MASVQRRRIAVLSPQEKTEAVAHRKTVIKNLGKCHNLVF